jgi:hypothetical protein
MPWATPEEVLAMTGETVAVIDVALASALIDSKAGTSDDLPEDAMSDRDRLRLKKATIWQAIWVKDKPGLLTDREAVTQTSAAGSSQSRKNISAVVYAPMALLELEGLSWRGTRTVVVPPRVAAFQQVSFLNEASDGCGTWTPLP